MSPHPIRRTPALAGALAAAVLAAAPLMAQHEQHQHGQPQQPPRPAEAAPAPEPARPDQLQVEFSVGAAGDAARAPREREEAVLRVRLRDEAGQPARGLTPFAWVDVATGDDDNACRVKVGAFTEGTLHVKHGQINLRQPVDDLNGHFIAVLAKTPHIAVLDPVKGFGRTRMYTALPLRSPGADWATTPDDRRMFVTLPDSGEVAVINTLNWRVERNVKVGTRPTRALMHPAGARLWITDEAAQGGVVVLDAATAQVRETIKTGTGPYALAFSGDGKLAFVASRGAGTVTVIDAATLRTLGEVKTGRSPVSLAWSEMRGQLFVADEEDGTVVVIDPATRQMVERITMQPGLTSIRFAPDPAAGHGAHGASGAEQGGHPGHTAAAAGGGKLLFALNPKTGTAAIYDAEQRKVIRTLSGAPEPDQVAFSPSFAYVRAAGTPSVAMIPLSAPTTGAIGPHDYFPAGGGAPGAVSDGLGDVMIPAPGMHDAVYVANPSERMIYLFHYMEGMPIPHGGLTTYTFQPKAIRAVARGLREVEPGVYEANVRLERSGRYDLVLRNPEPYVLGCYAFEVNSDPALAASEALRIEPVAEQALAVGANRLVFRATDTRDHTAVADLADLRVQVASTSGFQSRMEAKPLGDGTYEVSLEVPEAGVYYVTFEAPSRGLFLRSRPPLMMRAGDAPAPAQASASSDEGR